MSTCHEMRGRIHARGDRGLSVESLLELEEHLAQCARCRTLAARVSAIDEALSVVPEPPLERLDVKRSVRAVRSAIEQRAPAAPAPRRSLPWIAIALPLAAAASFAAWLWFHTERASDALAPQRVEALAQAQTEPPPAAAQSKAPPLPNEPVAIQEPAPAGDETIDAERLAKVRDDVRVFLREASAALADPAASEPPLEFVARFDDSVRELARGGWPIARLVEPLANDADPLLAGAALRWLGLRSERIQSRTLRGAFARPELKLAACQALLDAGERGLENLAPALRDDELRPRVLATLRARHDGASIAFLERALRSRAIEAGSLALTQTLRTFAASGVEGNAALLRLASAHQIDESAALTALAEEPGCGARLSELLATSSRGIDTSFAVRAARRLRSHECLAWLAERCGERNLRSEAIDAIGEIGGVAGLQTLLAVRGQGRMDPSEIDTALARALAASDLAAGELVQTLTHTARDNDLRALYQASTQNIEASLVHAWLDLARSDRFTSQERRTLLLLAGEHGTASDAPRVAAIYTMLSGADKELRAAALLALATLGGPDALRAALEGLPPRTSSSILALCEGIDARDKPTALLLRVARALDANSPARP